MATTAKPALKLPESLNGYSEALLAALALPYRVTWPEELTYLEAQQPEAIGRVLVRAIHPELDGAAIGYLYREKLKHLDRTRLAQASRVSGKLAHYSNLDLLVEVNWDRWRFLHDAQRIAIIDHELTHFMRDQDSKGNTVYKLVAHDLEEFASIVRRWGVWKRDIAHFQRAISDGSQLGIFDETLL